MSKADLAKPSHGKGRERQAKAGDEYLLDRELVDLRWREWMLRVEAVIFAAAEPVGRETLARVVGKDCSIDLLPANIAKMSRGEPLTDDDRWPWLTLVGQKLADPDGILIIGCSALKRRYRDHIRDEAGAPVTFVHLSGSRELITARMAARAGHFMPTSLIDSQFAALEPPAADENAITVDIDTPLEAIVDQVVSLLRIG